MIDRVARTEACQLIRNCLSQQTSIDELENNLIELSWSGHDPTRGYVVLSFMEMCDNDRYEVSQLNKQEWDFIQRLLLMLESESEMHSNAQWHWSSTQLLAVLTVTLFCVAILSMDWHPILILIIELLPAIVWGLNHMLMRSLEKKSLSRAWGSNFHAIAPFQTMRDIEQAYQSVNFQKQRYPFSSRKQDKPLSIVQKMIDSIICYVAKILVAPIQLLTQCFPLYFQTQFAVFTPNAK